MKQIIKKTIKLSQIETFQEGVKSLGFSLNIKTTLHLVKVSKYLFGLFSYSTIIILVEGEQYCTEEFITTINNV